MQSLSPRVFAHLGPIQIAVLALTGAAAIAGALVTIIEPHTLSFSTYTTQVLPELAGALSVLGIGKAIHLASVEKYAGEAAKYEPRAAAVVSALQRGDFAAALGAVESAIPAPDLPTDAEEDANPAPTPRRAPPVERRMYADSTDQPTQVIAGTGIAPDLAPQQGTPEPAPQEASAPPAVAGAPPLTPEELASFHALRDRAAAAGQE